MANTSPENEFILASSVALWLENKGISKVLKRFLSATQIQVTEEVLNTETTKDKKSTKRSAEAAENVMNLGRLPRKEKGCLLMKVEELKSKKPKGQEEGKDAGAKGHAREINNEGTINNGVDKSSQQKSARRQDNISAENIVSHIINVHAYADATRNETSFSKEDSWLKKSLFH